MRLTIASAAGERLDLMAEQLKVPKRKLREKDRDFAQRIVDHLVDTFIARERATGKPPKDIDRDQLEISIWDMQFEASLLWGRWRVELVPKPLTPEEKS